MMKAALDLATTQALGEEVTTQALGEEGTTHLAGEEVTTEALGEEGPIPSSRGNDEETGRGPFGAF